MTYSDLVNVNKEMKLTPIKGKDYAEVNQRVKAFRMLYPEGFIRTQVLSANADEVVMTAEVGNGDTVLATGTARETQASSNINRTSYVENCETSAVGRALGFLGLGIDTSICSADELSVALVAQAESEPQKFDSKPISHGTVHTVCSYGAEQFICTACGKPIEGLKVNGKVKTPAEIAKGCGGMCYSCWKAKQ